MGIYQGLSEYKPDAQASASILAYTRLRFGLVLVRNYLLLALLSLLGPILVRSNQAKYRLPVALRAVECVHWNHRYALVAQLDRAQLS